MQLSALAVLAVSIAAARAARAGPAFTDFAGPAALGDAFQRLRTSPVAARTAPGLQLNYAGYDEGMFSPPVETLSALGTDDFVTLASHPAYPKHGVRVKKSTFCDGGVNAYTGYIDIEAKHLFFYFFESRSNPDKDDVIFWTNGGPGCSSAIGLFMELGPCRVDDASLKPKLNPHAWNDAANVFFVDQPVGVGFSYADHGEHVDTTEEAAIDIAAFVAIFFENFSQFKGRAFHMAGESYGGRYVPLFASAVYDLNPRLVDAGFAPINLTSVMIGNGLTDFTTMTPSYYDMQCTPASVAPILPIAACAAMKQALPRCAAQIQAECVDRFDALGCGAAAAFCATHIELPFFVSGMNPYDISRECEGDIGDTLCYPITKHISHYLSQNKTREALGVDPRVRKDFTSCAPAVGAAFSAAMDGFHPTQHYISALLERGVKALIYVGEYDWICNWVGNERWTRALDWSGGAAYGQLPLGNWEMDGEVVGKVRAHGPLSFVTIKGAGHMVPYDKPVESLEMVNRWLKGESF